MNGSSSAWIGFAGGIVGGLVSATLGQFLVVVRRRYQRREEIRRVLMELSELSESDIRDAKNAVTKNGIGSEPEVGVHIWQLRSQLRDSLSKSYSCTSPETRELAEEVIQNYSYLSRHLDQTATATTGTAHDYVAEKAQEALDSLENESHTRLFNWP
jgi:NH3-dependent NAD+ synthetase